MVASYIYPTIILVGIECGLNIRSGTMPLAVNGISDASNTLLMIALHPDLLAILSPYFNFLMHLSLITIFLIYDSSKNSRNSSTKAGSSFL